MLKSGVKLRWLLQHIREILAHPWFIHRMFLAQPMANVDQLKTLQHMGCIEPGCGPILSRWYSVRAVGKEPTKNRVR